jgi:hypothetical protein
MAPLIFSIVAFNAFSEAIAPPVAALTFLTTPSI